MKYYPHPYLVNRGKCLHFTHTRSDNFAKLLYFIPLSCFGSLLVYIPVPGWYIKIDILTQVWSKVQTHGQSIWRLHFIQSTVWMLFCWCRCTCSNYGKETYSCKFPYVLHLLPHMIVIRGAHKRLDLLHTEVPFGFHNSICGLVNEIVIIRCAKE